MSAFHASGGWACERHGIRVGTAFDIAGRLAVVTGLRADDIVTLSHFDGARTWTARGRVAVNGTLRDPDAFGRFRPETLGIR